MVGCVLGQVKSSVFYILSWFYPIHSVIQTGHDHSSLIYSYSPFAFLTCGIPWAVVLSVKSLQTDLAHFESLPMSRYLE